MEGRSFFAAARSPQLNGTGEATVPRLLDGIKVESGSSQEGRCASGVVIHTLINPNASEDSLPRADSGINDV